MKTKQLALLTTITLAVALTGARAQDAAPAPAPAPAPDGPTAAWVLTPSFASQYMFRGVRLGGPSFQPSVEFDYGSLAVGVWSNFPLKDRVPGQSDPEFDVYGSYAFTAIPDKLTVVPGFTYYAYPDAETSNGFYRDSFEPNIAVNYTVGVLKLTPKIYYDVVLEGATYELTAAVAVPLKDLGTELDFTGTIGTFKWDAAIENASPDIKNWGDYWLIGVAMPFQITKQSKLTLGVAYTKGSNNYLKQGTDPRVPNSSAVGRTVVTVSYAWTF